MNKGDLQQMCNWRKMQKRKKEKEMRKSKG